MKVRIASWNILNDYWADDGSSYPTQQQRADSIIAELQKMMKSDARVIVFLCELEESNLNKICQETGLVAIGEPQMYERLANVLRGSISRQSAVFLADKKTAIECSSQRIRTASKKRDLLIRTTFHDLQLIGTHIPQRPIIDFFTRREHLKEILALKPSMIMGDFNASPLFPLRWRLTQAGYREVHKNKRPPFPHPFYYGKNIARYIPTMNIDVQYAQPTVQAADPNYSLSKASDHPLIWSDVEVA